LGVGVIPCGYLEEPVGEAVSVGAAAS
jgi:hypothetical protein